MKTLFQAGQIVRFKNYTPLEGETEAYFVVLMTKKDLWIQGINTNRYYKAGWSLVPLDINDLEVVQIKAHHLLQQEVVIKERLYHENVVGHVLSVDQPESPLIFSKVADGFESNTTYYMSSDILNGKIHIAIPTIITSRS
jgi:hypothetical protein